MNPLETYGKQGKRNMLEKTKKLFEKMEYEIAGTYDRDERTFEPRAKKKKEIALKKTSVSVKKGMNHADRTGEMFKTRSAQTDLQWQNWACRLRLLGYTPTEIMEVFIFRFRSE